jgi:hypothetical protein
VARLVVVDLHGHASRFERLADALAAAVHDPHLAGLDTSAQQQQHKEGTRSANHVSFD